MADVTFYNRPEKTTHRVTFTLKDELGAVIPGASLSTCTLTLYDAVTLAIINSRDHVDVKAFVNGSGVFDFTFATADFAILNDALQYERHVALIEWTYPTSKRGQYEIEFQVRNTPKVT